MGTTVEVIENTLVAYFKVTKGRADLFAGGPLVEGNTYWTAAGSAQVITCPHYPIPADGVLSSWCVFQGNSTSGQLPFELGEMKLVILYQDGTDYKVRAIAEMTRRITRKGIWEFPISPGIEVMRNDIVAFWIKASSNLQVVGQADRAGTVNPIRVFTEADPQPGDNLGAGAPNITSPLLAVTVRSDIVADALVDVDRAWRSTSSDEDTYGYVGFTQGSNAFDDAGWTTPANLFDENDATNAQAPTGTTKNIYYFLPHAGGGLFPIERFILKASPATGGRVSVYVSENIAVAQSLVGAQAIPAEEWIKIVDLPAPSSIIHDELEYHVARKAKWVRLEVVGGTSAATTVGAFEIRSHQTEVLTGGQLAPHNGTGLKDRLHFNGDSHAGGDQISAVLTADIGATTVKVSVASAEAKFFTQLATNDYVWLRRNLPLGSPSKLVRVKVAGVDGTAKEITLEAGPGEAFSTGDFVDPDPSFYHAIAYKADGSVFAASNWLGNHSTDTRWLRNHDVYTAAGN